jgi:hypothetical protein
MIRSLPLLVLLGAAAFLVVAATVPAASAEARVDGGEAAWGADPAGGAVRRP